MKFGAVILVTLLAFSAFAGARVVVPQLPPSPYDDTEISTNVTFSAGGDDARFFSQVAICDEAVSNAVAAVDVQLASCVSALPNGDRGCPTYMMEFGMPDGMMASETELGLLVSNHIEVVYSNFSAIATTKVEKMLLLASAWRLGDDYYLNCLSRNVDLATSGDIAADDLQWFMKGHRTRRLSYILADRYDSPGVSNIVQRLIAYTGETNKYEKVLSGQAKIEHAEFEQFLADGPESPRQNQ